MRGCLRVPSMFLLLLTICLCMHIMCLHMLIICLNMPIMSAAAYHVSSYAHHMSVHTHAHAIHVSVHAHHVCTCSSCDGALRMPIICLRMRIMYLLSKNTKFNYYPSKCRNYEYICLSEAFIILNHSSPPDLHLCIFNWSLSKISQFYIYVINGTARGAKA